MPSVGSILRKEREKKHIQLSEISASTKIPERYLRAIEKDDYSVFPAETYLIGFIRNYARELELDPNEIVSLYKNSLMGKEQVKNVNEEKTTFVVPEKANLDKKRNIRKKIREEKNIMPVEEKTFPQQQNLEKEKIDVSNKVSVKNWFSDFIKFIVFIFKNQISLLITLGGIILAILLIILLFVLKPVKNKTPKDSIDKVQIIHFEQDTGVFDLNLNEYYRLKLGKNLYPVMGEILNPSDAADMTIRLLLHFDRSQYELVPGLSKELDIELDGTPDVSFKLNSISETSYNMTIYKLHAFLTNETNITQTQTSGIKTNINLKSGNKNKNDSFTSIGGKKQIVFHAEVVQKTYVKAWIDSKEEEGKVWYPGQNFDLVAQEVIQLKIGNPAGLNITINGTPVKFSGQGVVSKTIKWKRDLFDENVYNLVILDWQ